uniref:Uncharacterized protein n=1 Tax=Nelumbo nucifera TaxID=4432 RepID=A0A822YGA5_NELNU|nr:TPA_asm: hypothetical protein HUJ06_010034 [Nelumbo nucifera]
MYVEDVSAPGSPEFMYLESELVEEK